MRHRFVTGDPEALRELYVQFAGPVLTVALSRLTDETLAQEVVQDVFTKAWQHRSRFDPRREPGPWLYQIARRSAADVVRRESRRPHTTSLRLSLAAQDTTTLVDTWEAWEVRRAVERLASIDCELMRLTHHLGLTQAEIARRLDMPIGTVKSRTHRAHKQLAQLLAHMRPPAAVEEGLTTFSQPAAPPARTLNSSASVGHAPDVPAVVDPPCSALA